MLLGAVVGSLAGALASGDAVQPAAIGPTPAAKEPDDALLILESKYPQDAEQDFLRVASFYGLSVSKLDLSTARLTDAALRDASGQYYRTVFVVGATLDANVD